LAQTLILAHPVKQKKLEDRVRKPWGDCYDNAAMESLFHSLKVERVKRAKDSVSAEVPMDGRRAARLISLKD
jgi:hypothetical protein